MIELSKLIFPEMTSAVAMVYVTGSIVKASLCLMIFLHISV